MKLPCKTCIILAICKSKCDIECELLYKYESYYNFSKFPIEELPEMQVLQGRTEVVEFTNTNLYHPGRIKRETRFYSV